jgi:hypothetical protein
MNNPTDDDIQDLLELLDRQKQHWKDEYERGSFGEGWDDELEVYRAEWQRWELAHRTVLALLNQLGRQQ